MYSILKKPGNKLYSLVCRIIPIRTKHLIDRVLGKPRKWTIAFVILAGDEIHNFVNKLQIDILDQYGVETAPPHITLKLGFEVTKLEPYACYFDRLVKDIEPFQICVNGIKRFAEKKYDEGIIFIEVERNPKLDALRQRILSDLNQEFGIYPYRLEGEQFHYHITLAYGLSRQKFHKAYKRLKNIPVQGCFTLGKMSLLCHTGVKWISYRQHSII